MTTGIAMVGADGVIMASDSKTNPKGETVPPVCKIFSIGRDNGIVCAGIHGVGERLQRYLLETVGENSTLEKYRDRLEELMRRSVNEQISPVSGIETVLYQWVNKSEDPKEIETAARVIHGAWIQTYNPQVILAGRESSGEYAIYLAVTNATPYQPRRIKEKWATIGEDRIMRYWLQRLGLGVKWNHTAISIKQLDRLMMFLIGEAAASDSTVGLPLQLAHITKEEGFHWEIEPPPALANDYHAQLRDSCERVMSGMLSQLTPQVQRT